MQSPFDSPLSGFRSPFGGRRLSTAVSALAAYAIAGFTPKLVFNFETETYATGGAVSTFDDSITFARASTATMVNSSGALVEVASGVPRRGHHVYDGTSYVNEGLLLESQARTNLLDYSVPQVDGTGMWNSLSNATGTTNDEEVTITCSGGDAGWRCDGLGLQPNTTYTGSIEAKNGTARYVYMRHIGVDGGADGVAWFDINNGVVSTVGAGLDSAEIEEIGGGYYRCSITGTTSDPLDFDLFDFRAGDSDGNFTSSTVGETMTFRRAQIEPAETPSSYIPTSGATVTRAAETLTVPAAKLPYDSTNVSIQMDGRMTYAATGKINEVRFLSWHNVNDNRIRSELSTSSSRTGQLAVITFANNNVVQIFSGTSEYSPGILIPYNFATTHASTFLAGASKGVSLTEDTSSINVPDVEDKILYLTTFYMGTVRTLRIWTDDLGDSGREEASA